MPRHLLTAKEIIAARDRELADGDGLFIRIRGEKVAAALRYTSPLSGLRREMGLGKLRRDNLAAVGDSLAEVRAAADDARRLLARNLDPIDQRERAADEAPLPQAGNGEAVGSRVTLRRYVQTYHKANVEPVRTPKHAQQWINSIEQHLPATLLGLSLDRVTAVELLDALVPVMRQVPETGSRVYQRLATVFDAAVIEGLRRDNPATPIRRELRKRAGRREKGHYAALAYQQAPGVVKRLRQAKGNAARCLEFAILTAARTSEALMSEWREFDREQRIWTVPPSRMKRREKHVVYLSDRALEILDGQTGKNETYVFPSTIGWDAPMSNMALAMALRRVGVQEATVHGFRSTFSTWANELGIAKPDAIEAALAHREADAVRRAYNRSQFLAERRALMVAWGEYLAGAPLAQPDGERDLLAVNGRPQATRRKDPAPTVGKLMHPRRAT